MQKTFPFSQWILFLCLLFSTLPVFPGDVKIKGYEPIGMYNGYPLYDISENEIEVSSSSGNFNYVYIDGDRITYSYSSYWATCILSVSTYLDGSLHKIQLKQDSSDCGVCYFWNATNDGPIYSNDGPIYSIIDDNAIVTGFNSQIETAVNIKSSIEKDGKKYPVTAIAPSAFNGCSNIESIVIPASVNSIGNYAFNGCTSLKEVIIEASDTHLSLGTGSSQGSSSGIFTDSPLESLSLGRDLTYPSSYIGNGPFYNRNLLSNVSIGSKVTEIGYALFYGCSAIESITIPASITSISDDAFTNCKQLRELIIEDHTQELSLGSVYSSSSRKALFQDCPLTSIYLGRNLSYNTDQNYGFSPFYSQKGLLSLAIGNLVTDLRENAFRECEGLQEISFGKSLTKINKNAFFNCKHNISLHTFSYHISGIKDCGLSSSTNVIIFTNGDFDIDIFSTNLIYFQSILVNNEGREYAFVSAPETFLFTNCLASSSECFLVDSNSVNTVKDLGNHEYVEFRGTYIDELLCSDNGFSFKPSPYHVENCFSGIETNIQKNIILKQPGTLFDEVGFQDIETIAKLTITGDLNGTDIMTLNRMKEIKILDISNANIVEGGTTYRENLKTKNDVIGSYFFYNISPIVLKLPNSVSVIEKNAFNNKDFRIVEIGNKTKNIEQEAFYLCKNISDLMIPCTVESIGNNAFVGCRSLRNLTIADGITTLNFGYSTYNNGLYSLFSDCPLKSVYLGRNISYKSEDRYIYSPFNYSHLDSLIIGNLVTSIPQSAFSGCDNLRDLKLGSSISTIGEAAFAGCHSLTELNIGNSTISIGDRAFYGCEGLKRITISNSVSTIGKSAFYYCNNLEKISIGASVTSIGSNAFESCYSLARVEVANIESFCQINFANELSNPLYYAHHFYINDQEITQAIIPPGVSHIGSYAFINCSNLKEVHLPNSITSIGKYAFNNCSGMVKVAVERVETLCQINFENMSSNPLYFAKHLYINDMEVKTVAIPENITSIGNYAFINCIEFENIEFGTNINEIGEYAFFGNNSLEKIVLPNNLTKIGSYAFAKCTLISQLYSLNTIPPIIMSSTFDATVKENATLHVNKRSLVHYWLDPVWKEFKNMADNIIYFEEIPMVTYGDEHIDLGEYAPEGVILTYESSNPEVARIDGTILHIVGAGVATIRAICEETGEPMEIIGELRQFKINPADLIVTVEDISLSQGDPIPVFNFIAEGLRYDDTLADLDELPEIYCEATSDSAPGEYPIIIKGGKSKNYAITTLPATLFITMPTGIEDTQISDNEISQKSEVYNLNGIKIFEGNLREAELQKGIYIVREGKKTLKIAIQ